MTNEEKIYAVGFKGFDPDMKCRDKQYAENTVFEEKGGDICDAGVMHFCEYPLDIFHYYPPVSNGKINTYAPVEALAEYQKKEDKYATTKIRIGAKISFAGLAKAAINLVMERVKKEKTESTSGDESVASTSGNESVASTSGNWSVASTSGFKSVASTSGKWSVASTSGDESVASTSGNWSVASTSGNGSVASTSGDESVASTSGNESVASTSGNWSVASTSGFKSVASTSGKWSVASTSGDESVASTSGNWSVASTSGNGSVASVGGQESFAIATGIDGKAKGALGCYIACAEWTQDKNCDWHIKYFKTAKVDGKKIKPDTFYMLNNGKFVKVKHGE